ncbi:MAG: carbohydrate ABC transporter permease [Ruminococcaceae bacterium]|nr:carbohydrate ABC transporter permease [Oscillospiraceae bacterium]
MKINFKLKLPQKRSSGTVRKYTRSKFGNFMFFAFLFLFGAFSVLPLIYSVVTSFKPLDELLVFPPTLFTVKRPTINNYLALPELISGLNIPLSRYLTNSLFISFAGTFLHVIAATAAAFVLSKIDLKFKKTIFLVIQLSLLFNAYTLSIPRYLIYNGMGIIDSYWVYILPAIPSSMGVFLMKQYMDGYIPDALIEAAKIDGANYLRIFWNIIFPNVKPCVLTLVLFAFQSIWATIPTGTIFNESLKTLPTVMATISSGGIARSGAAMAATVIMMIPPIVVYLFSQSSIKETMGSAGIKG